MAVTALTTFGLAKHFYFNKLGSLVTGDNQLGDAFAVVYGELLIGEVDKHDTYLAPVVGIDSPRGVKHGDAMLQSQAATGTHLCLIARWKGDVQTRGNEPPLQRAKHYGLVNVGPKIHAGTLRRGILRQWLMAAVHYFYFHCLYGFALRLALV